MNFTQAIQLSPDGIATRQIEQTLLVVITVSLQKQNLYGLFFVSRGRQPRLEEVTISYDLLYSRLLLRHLEPSDDWYMGTMEEIPLPLSLYESQQAILNWATREEQRLEAAARKAARHPLKPWTW